MTGGHGGQMSGVADRIILDGEILAQQERTLGDVAATIGAGISGAQTSVGQTAFGAINGFLAGAISSWASHTARAVSTAAELAERMHDGVVLTRTTFDQVEQTLEEGFNGGEDGDEG